jgi:hypothetical protein
MAFGVEWLRHPRSLPIVRHMWGRARLTRADVAGSRVDRARRHMFGARDVHHWGGLLDKHRRRRNVRRQGRQRVDCRRNGGLPIGCRECTRCGWRPTVSDVPADDADGWDCVPERRVVRLRIRRCGVLRLRPIGDLFRRDLVHCRACVRTRQWAVRAVGLPTDVRRGKSVQPNMRVADLLLQRGDVRLLGGRRHRMGVHRSGERRRMPRGAPTVGVAMQSAFVRVRLRRTARPVHMRDVVAVDRGAAPVKARVAPFVAWTSSVFGEVMSE